MQRDVITNLYKRLTKDKLTKSGTNVFKGLGSLDGDYHMQISCSVAPVVHLPRKAPFALKERLKAELDRMETIGAITKVAEPTKIFEDIQGAEIFVDDILIWGKDEEEQSTEASVTEKARDINLKLNAEKSKIQATEVTYIGHIMSSVGMKPDPSKIKAIKDIGTQQDKKELLRFIGMVNYLGKLISGLSDMTHPLREHLKKDIEWHWSCKHDQAFNKIKESLTKEST